MGFDVANSVWPSPGVLIPVLLDIIGPTFLLFFLRNRNPFPLIVVPVLGVPGRVYNWSANGISKNILILHHIPIIHIREFESVQIL